MTEGEKSVSFTFPSWIWKLALVTSAVIGILQITGVAHVPWWMFLVPLAIPLALGLAVFIGVVLVGLIVLAGTAIYIAVDDWNMKRKRKPIKMKVVKKP